MDYLLRLVGHPGTSGESGSQQICDHHTTPPLLDKTGYQIKKDGTCGIRLEYDDEGYKSWRFDYSQGEDYDGDQERDRDQGHDIDYSVDHA